VLAADLAGVPTSLQPTAAALEKKLSSNALKHKVSPDCWDDNEAGRSGRLTRPRFAVLPPQLEKRPSLEEAQKHGVVVDGLGEQRALTQGGRAVRCGH
jgi:hypothetical protein